MIPLSKNTVIYDHLSCNELKLQTLSEKFDMLIRVNSKDNELDFTQYLLFFIGEVEILGESLFFPKSKKAIDRQYFNDIVDFNKRIVCVLTHINKHIKNMYIELLINSLQFFLQGYYRTNKISNKETKFISESDFLRIIWNVLERNRLIINADDFIVPMSILLQKGFINIVEIVDFQFQQERVRTKNENYNSKLNLACDSLKFLLNTQQEMFKLGMMATIKDINNNDISEEQIIFIPQYVKIHYSSYCLASYVQRRDYTFRYNNPIMNDNDKYITIIKLFSYGNNQHHVIDLISLYGSISKSIFRYLQINTSVNVEVLVKYTLESNSVLNTCQNTKSVKALINRYVQRGWLTCDK